MTISMTSAVAAIKKRTNLGSGSDDPDVNPFQVYPVRGLSEVQDIESITVATNEIQDVHNEVVAYANALSKRTDPPAKLLLAARGDFGTGKTHLMLYARAVLISERAREEQRQSTQPKVLNNEPLSSGETLAPVIALVVSSEAPIEEWYATELGPTLVEIASPRELVRELLTRVACKVASDEQDPELRELADEFRRSRRALYQAFRNPGEFDISAVEERFAKEIEAACPRTSRSFRRAIAALRWEETAEIAEDWLAGNELPADEMTRLGVRQGDIATRAANTICAVASLCLRLGRPFGLFIDEFEHLTRYDAREHSKRNITWTKRLVESLARRGAMVFICGHWDAWEQRGDFLDRFVGGRPIQLVRLNADDVLKVVAARAGESAWEGFTKETARAVIEETSGNIRRVMTVLYDLWANEAIAPTEFVTLEMVRQAAYRRLQPGSEAGILPTIERAIKGNDCLVRRDDKFGDPPEEVDMTARRDGQLRLIVRVVHARDELALLDGGAKFAGLVKAARAANPLVRGLCVTLGAVIEKHVLALDAAYPETDLVNGEAPDVIEHLPSLVANALAKVPAPATEQRANPEALVALGQNREGAILRADAQFERTMEIIGVGDGRSDAVRQAVSADPIALANLKTEQARVGSFSLISADIERPTRVQFVNLAPRSGVIAGVTVLTVLLWTGAIALRVWAAAPTAPSVSVSPTQSTWIHSMLENSSVVADALMLLGGFLAFVDLWLCWRLYSELGEYRRYRLQTMHRLFVEEAPTYVLNQTNAAFENILVRRGPRMGLIDVMRYVELNLLDSNSNPAVPEPDVASPPISA